MEKTSKYGPLRWELKQRHPDYKITQHTIIIVVLGGYYKNLTKTLMQLVGNRYRSVAAQMQKSVVTSSLHIARSFKVLAHQGTVFSQIAFWIVHCCYVLLGFYLNQHQSFKILHLFYKVLQIFQQRKAFQSRGTRLRIIAARLLSVG